MVTALRTDMGMKLVPTKVDDGPALVEDFRLDADYTAYRVVVVRLGGDQLLILADPAGPYGAAMRRYMPLNDEPGTELSQDYVGEKLGYDRDGWRGPDCRNITILMGYALQRPVLVVRPGTDGFERIEPTEPADPWT